MSETDSHVQVAAEGSGKKIDNAALTRADLTLVQRQRVAVGDPSNPEAPGVGVAGELGRGMTLGELAVIGLLERIDHRLESIAGMLTLVLNDNG